MSIEAQRGMGLRVVIYARVSKAGAQHSRSIAEQVELCRRWAESQGWSVEAVIEEVGSASEYASARRTGWDELLDVVSSGRVDALLTWDASRATRALDSYLDLRALCAVHGVAWSYGGRLYDLRYGPDRFATALDALVAQDEAAQISARTVRSLRHGENPPGPLPWGFRRLFDPHTAAFAGVVLDPVVAELVRAAAADVADGVSLSAVAARWNARGVATPGRAKRWSHTAVRRVVTNPVYVRGPDPVLSSDVQTAVVARLAGHRKRITVPQTLLSGLARCGVCGGGVRGSTQSRGVGAYAQRVKVPAYRCSSATTHILKTSELADRPVVGSVLDRLSTTSVFHEDGTAESALARRVEDLRQQRRELAQFERDAYRAASERRDFGLATVVSRYAGPFLAELSESIRQAAALPQIVVDLGHDEDREGMFWGLSLEERRLVVATTAVPVLHPRRQPPTYTWKL